MSPRSRRRGSGSSRPSQRNRRQRTPAGGNQRDDGAGFWGDVAKLPEARPDIRITDDPAAVPRSLGPPPLPGHEAIAEHYFAAVYERAVMLAGALAAAGGLIEPEALLDDEDE